MTQIRPSALTRTRTLQRAAEALGVTLGPRQIKVQCSGPAEDRMGDIVVQTGIDIGQFQRSPTVFWNHDTSLPIAKAVWTGLERGCLTSIAQFPALGTDETSDRIYRLIAADMPLDVSIGFIPTETEPVDPRDPWGGTRFLRVELLEWSVVGIGAQRDSRITAKSLRGTGTRAADLEKAAKIRARMSRAASIGKITGYDAARRDQDFLLAIRKGDAIRLHNEIRHRHALAVAAALIGPGW